MATSHLSFRGWLALVASFTILTVAFAFGLFSLPVFYPALVKHFAWNRASVAAGGSIVLFLIGVLSPAVGWLVDRFSAKAVLLGGMLVVALALALLSLTNSLAEYYAFCVLLGIGTSAVSIMPTSLLVGPWFTRGRGVAVGFINAGIGLGGYIVPRLVASRIEARGFSYGFLFLSFCVAIPFLLTLPAGQRGAGPAAARQHAAPLRAPRAAELVRMPMYWIFGVSLFFSAHAMLAVQQHLILYLSGQGLTVPRAAVVLSLALGISSIGKILSGLICDHFSARLAMMLSVLCVSLGIVTLLSVPPGSAFMYLFEIFFGLGYGGIFNASPTIVFEYFGTERVGTALGLIYIFFGLGTASGGLLAGFIFDRVHRYSVPFTLDLALSAVALLLLLVSGRQTSHAAVLAKPALSTP